MPLTLRSFSVLAAAAPAVGIRLGARDLALEVADEKECGVWSYGGMCSDLTQCAYKPETNDTSLDESCRVRQCGDVKLEGEVFKNRMWGKFRNWGDEVDTCSPWVMPVSENEIREVLKFAREKGFKVRMSGASHSAGGLVVEPEDEKVIVMSLADYVSDRDFSTTDMPDGSKRAWVNAGWTLLDLYEKIRPEDYFLPTQTAAPFFSLAGIVSNTVHGGAYQRGFINGYVTGLRVMDANGTVTELKDEGELRYWRNSFGLLGVILNIEFQLEKRNKLEMEVIQENLTAWNSTELWRFIKQTAKANLTEDHVPSEGGKIDAQAWNGEFFVDFLNGDKPLMGVYSQKANASATKGSGAPAYVAQAYAGLKAQEVTIEDHGNMTWDQAARRMGSPPDVVPNATAAFKYRVLNASKLFSLMTISTLHYFVDPMRQTFNDGFLLTKSPVVVEVAYFVEPEKAFKCMDIIREVQLEYAHQGSDFLFATPGEFRFLNVEDSAVLQPVDPGLWFNCQLIVYPDFAKNDQAWKTALSKVEKRWRTELNGKPHLGKIFGLNGEPGNVTAFSPEVVCKAIDHKRKIEFANAMGRWDPTGLFSSGLAKRLMADC